MSLLEKLRAECLEVEQPADPWRAPLHRVRGKVEFDGMERISTQALLDILEVPQRERKAGMYRHVCKLMVELGWSPTRVRDLNGRGYREQIRGFVRTTHNI